MARLYARDTVEVLEAAASVSDPCRQKTQFHERSRNVFYDQVLHFLEVVESRNVIETKTVMRVERLRREGKS